MKTKRTPVSSSSPCPIAVASRLVGDIWTLLIVRDLLVGPKRFSDFQASIILPDEDRAISTKTLTDRLKMLEKEGIVTRHAFAHEKPPRVEYELTKQGKDLSGVIETLRAYGERYGSC
jgi:DNA-binding HxlR family transcriptional regulator